MNAVGLRHNAAETELFVLSHDRIVQISARQNRPGFRVDCQQSPYCLVPPMPPGMFKSMITASKGASAFLAS